MSKQTTSPALYGIETEYSCMVTHPDDKVYEIVGSCHSIDAQLDLYQQPETKGTNFIDQTNIKDALAEQSIIVNKLGMLSNGGRLYIDPSGPEYATPETTTAEDAVLSSFDGDTIVLRAFAHMRDQGLINSYQINRRIVDHNRTSRGIHLNTLTKLANKNPNERVIEWLATLNIAKGALFGSGGLLLNEFGETEYHHSPRLSITNNIDMNANSYTRRPLVRRPFKDDIGKLSRIETVTSDALNFGWPLRASLITSNAVIGLIEMGYGDKLPTVATSKAISSAQDTGKHGPEGSVVIEYGQIMHTETSLSLLNNFVETVLEVDQDKGQLDHESRQVLNEVIEICDKMTENPSSTAAHVESVARKLAMEQKMSKHNIGLDSERMCRFDYAWDWLGGGIAETLRDKGIGWHGFNQSKLTSHAAKKRIVTAPADTRASVRAAFIEDTNGECNSTWERINVDGFHQHIKPLDTNTPFVAELYSKEDN